MKKYPFLIVLLAFLVSIPLCGTGAAAEHGGNPLSEHPGKAVTARSVKNAIKDHVKAVAGRNNGVFAISDDKLKKEWRLKLDKIHDPVRRFEKDGKTIYFACSDFKSTEGNDVLDIDFWIVENSGKMEVIDTRIHKVNGEPRFTYEGTELREVK